MASGAGPRPNPDGLLMQLDAANTRSYAGFGSSLYDLSISGISGTTFVSTYTRTYKEGFLGYKYSGYFNDDMSYFTDQLRVAGPTYYNSINLSDEGDYYSYMWTGKFFAPTTGVYTFTTASDDSSLLWVGTTAVTNYTVANSLINNSGVHGTRTISNTTVLTGGIYYDTRIMFGENAGGANMTLNYALPSASLTTNGFTYFYSPSLNTARIKFDGTNDNFVVDPNKLVYGTNSRTLIAWINPYSISSGIAFGYGTTSNNNSFSIGVFSNAYYVDAWYSGFSAGSPVLYSWSQLATTYDGTNLIIYANGVAIGSTTRSWSTNKGVAYLGDNVNGNGKWQGEIGPVLFFNRVLSSTEILQNYNATKGRYL
jgi:hypothetical protein